MSRLRFLKYLFQDVGRSISPAPHRPDPAAWPSDTVTAAWLGHATVLIDFCGLRILTDPTFFARIGIRVGPLTFGPKRYIACALKPQELPPLDLLLLSHAHMDHLDLRSLRQLPRDLPVVTARGTSRLLRRFHHVRELGWNETLTLPTAHGEIVLTAFRLRHWGARFPWDHQSSYNAYVLERAGRRLCFFGDSARTDAHHLGSRSPIDLMMIPISAYHPWITNHCTPEEAVEMADEAGARYVMPIHHETFKLSWEPLDEPIRRFRAALAQHPQRLALAEIGETWRWPGEVQGSDAQPGNERPVSLAR
jgi:L-ascorbate metabolism protein UlaG (beta-lactamase superfamily)